MRGKAGVSAGPAFSVTVPSSPPATKADVDVLLAALAALAARVAVLERQRGRPDDRWDTGLRRVLPDSTRGLPFTTRDLLAHADVDEGLRSALRDAAIDTSCEAGCWLRRHVGVADGVQVERLPRRRWRVAYTSST